MYDIENTVEMSGHQANHYTLLENTRILVVFAPFVSLIPMEL